MGGYPSRSPIWAAFDELEPPKPAKPFRLGVFWPAPIPAASYPLPRRR
jgi:hypothetical protein